jgi:hypothetical protein
MSNCHLRFAPDSGIVVGGELASEGSREALSSYDINDRATGTKGKQTVLNTAASPARKPRVAIALGVLGALRVLPRSRQWLLIALVPMLMTAGHAMTALTSALGAQTSDFWNVLLSGYG